jgi:hypothetical protein
MRILRLRQRGPRSERASAKITYPSRRRLRIVRSRFYGAFAQLALLLSAALIAATPAPRFSPPTTPLHTAYVVEVNRHGQVVRVTGHDFSKNALFNLQTFGNAQQMWIRHPNGTADVGLYRVSYDYDPRTRKVLRRVSLVRLGGTWANAQGAANAMMDEARRQAEAESGKNLPSLKNIIDATPTPR